ncbi:MAG: hypothetical protein WB677_07225 [Xanthobacteraceae bacterium]
MEMQRASNVSRTKWLTERFTLHASNTGLVTILITPSAGEFSTVRSDGAVSLALNAIV